MTGVLAWGANKSWLMQLS